MTSVIQIAIGICVASSLFAAQQYGIVVYARGDIEGLPRGTHGYLQLRDDHEAAFHTRQGTVRLPYDRMTYEVQPRHPAYTIILGPLRRNYEIRLEIPDDEGKRLAMIFRSSRRTTNEISNILKERTSAAVRSESGTISSKLGSSPQ